VDYTEYYKKEYATLVGRKITGVRALSKMETSNLYWEHHREPGVVFILDDGTYFVPMQDDEGNGPGALLFEGRQ
jgi:hypothetical protein